MKKLILSLLIARMSMEVHSQGKIFVNGGTSTGIGSSGNNFIGFGSSNSSPTTHLHLLESHNGEMSLQIQNSYGGGTRTFLTSTPTRSLIQTDRDFGITTNGGGWSEKFTLLNNGYVGIGVVTPSERLDVNGFGKFRRQGSSTAGFTIGGDALLLQGWGANNPYIEWRNADGNRQGFMGWNTSRLSLTMDTGHNFTIESTSPTSGGKVGIGTATPVGKLDVNHVGGQLRLSGSSIAAGLWTTASNMLNLADWDTGTKGLNIDLTNGRVGIGTTSPVDLLDVNGFGRFRKAGSQTAGLAIGGDALSLRGWGANNPYVEWRNADNTRQGYMGWNTNRLSLMMENGYDFTIENGDVGIGTSSPDAKLAVKGDIHAKEVRVDILGSMVPDYVFEQSYSLPSLDSVQSYIDENKHLPEVPSAKEMEANGMNLGEMNLLLLKKIEELTLYVIELKDRDAQRQHEVAELRTKLEQVNPEKR